jgi:putative peptidoglycan lipid II flippase
MQAGVWERIQRLALVIAAGTISYFGALWLMGFRPKDFSMRDI